MARTRDIALSQNDSASLFLLRAIAVAHRQTQRAQAASLIFSVIIAGFGVYAKISDVAIPAVVILGTLWAAVYTLVVAPEARRSLQTGARLQEMFDTELFGLPWNRVLVGDPIAEDQVSRLSRRFHGDESQLRDFYLVIRVRPPYDVLFCFEQNLGWGARVRRRFAQGLIALVVLWCTVGAVAALATSTTVAALFSTWLLPSLGLLLLCSDLARAQITVTRDRERVRDLVEAVTNDPGSPHLVDEPAIHLFERQIQDFLYLARRQQPRTPHWFFRRYHDNDRRDFRYRGTVLEQRYGIGTP